MADDYAAEQNRRIFAKINEILTELPDCVTSYMVARRSNTTPKTRLSYAYDLKNFFTWLRDSSSELRDRPLRDISPEILSALTADDIERYLNFCQTGSESLNGERTVSRKLSCLSSFFSYLLMRDKIASNPCDRVLKPKPKKDDRIIKLTPDEVVRFLDTIEFGNESIPKRQRKYLENTKIRDLAIATLLLGTGIRVSECVGLDRRDLDFVNCKISIIRKGQKRQYVAMGDEVIAALRRYLEERDKITPAAERDSDALFLSTRRTRMCVQAVENMITKYAEFAGTKEHITPHKLRKTYGTELYGETGDIYLVARALGHENVNTTKDHYIDTDEESLLEARNKVKLR